MLWTDGNCITSADMTALDSEVAKVASSIGATLDDGTDNCVVNRALLECGNDMVASIQSYLGGFVPTGMNLALVNAVNNTGTYAVNRPRARLNQIVTIEPDPTKRAVQQWVLYATMEFFYRMAFRRLVEDRYEKKMKLWASETKRAWGILRGSGLPCVPTPLPRPGATGELGSGTWDTSNVTVTGSGTGSATNYDVAITWVNLASYGGPTNPANAESMTSARVTKGAKTGEVLNVSIASLNPPTGNYPNLGPADGIFTPMQATGWNVYVGSQGGTLWLQNSSPIAIGTTTWTATGAPTLSGNPASKGQWSLFNYAMQNQSMRA